MFMKYEQFEDARRNQLCVVENGVAKLGRLDFVVANAGIVPLAHDISAYLDTVDVLLNGVYFTIEAALPALLEHGEGGAIVITTSGAGLKSVVPTFSTQNHGAQAIPPPNTVSLASCATTPVGQSGRYVTVSPSPWTGGYLLNSAGAQTGLVIEDWLVRGTDGCWPSPTMQTMPSLAMQMRFLALVCIVTG
jgi:NAD(P)-dependent dehydrogenase (short-subunit alcohol dehydrogenase family)